MTTVKSYTDLEQSRKLAKILSLESADMYYEWTNKKVQFKDDKYNGMGISCWSLAALLKCLSEIKPQKYTFTLAVSDGKWGLCFIEYGRGGLGNEINDSPLDACVAMIIRLHELNLL